MITQTNDIELEVPLAENDDNNVCQPVFNI